MKDFFSKVALPSFIPHPTKEEKKELQIEEGKEEAFDGEDDEDVPVELSTLVVTGVDETVLPRGYKSKGHEILYDEVWDETAEEPVPSPSSEDENDRRL